MDDLELHAKSCLETAKLARAYRRDAQQYKQMLDENARDLGVNAERMAVTLERGIRRTADRIIRAAEWGNQNAA